jgi:hypothetical protein
MTQPLQTVLDYRTRLDTAVTSFSRHIHDLCPDARLDISFVRYETEDAHIWIAAPATMTEDQRDRLSTQVAEKSVDILLSEGFLILAGVEDPDLVDP